MYKRTIPQFTRDEAITIHARDGVHVGEKCGRKLPSKDKEPEATRRYYIYRITDPVSGLSYVGQTDEPKSRWNYHLWTAFGDTGMRRTHLQNVIAKRGKDGMEWKIIDEIIGLDASNEAEEFHIEHLNTLTPNGFNRTTGGESRSPTPEVRAQIGKTLQTTGFFVGKKGSAHPNWGRACTEEIKERLRDLFSGEGGAGTKITTTMARTIFMAIANGARAEDVAKWCGIQGGAVMNIAHKRSWKDALKDLPDIPQSTFRDMKVFGNAALTREQVIDLRDRFDLIPNNTGQRTAFIRDEAKRLGLSCVSIYKIARRKTYRTI